MDDYYIGQKTFEQAEIKMQELVIDNILKRNNLKNSDVDCLVGGDLTNQIAVSNSSAKNYNIPFLGLYSACATFTESLIVGASLIDAGSIKRVLGITSSHNLTAERQFRYPIEYGSPRRVTQHFTATGAVASLISKTPTSVKIESCTVGKIIDFGVKDANNMGAVMAPSAANTLIEHLRDFKRKPEYYDVILTGDLGQLGSELFKMILSKNDITLKNHIDAGCELIVDGNKTDQGASGPVCLPLYLVEKILASKKYKRILIIGTGSLQNQTLVNQKNTIPSVSHAVALEVLS